MTVCPICHNHSVETTKEHHTPLPLGDIVVYSHDIVYKLCKRCGWNSRFSNDNGKWEYSEHYGNIKQPDR